MMKNSKFLAVFYSAVALMGFAGELMAQEVSEPGVVRREGPKGRAGGDARAGEKDGETSINFGDQGQFETNFGDDFGVGKTPKNLKVTLDFRDAELSDVVKLMSAQTGRNFIIADSLRAGKKITIISPNPVSAEDAYRAFLSALQMNGLTVVQSGKFFKIVDSNTAPREALMPSWGASVPRSDAMVTHVFQPKFIDVTQVKTVVDQLKSSQGVIIDYPASNVLIITDTGNSVNRILSFLKKVDTSTAEGDKLWVYQVRHADAQEMEKLLSSVFQVKGNAKSSSSTSQKTEDVRISQIVADARTNRLIIVADARSYEKIKRLILKLDIEITDSSRINVVHLQNSEADIVATNLSILLSNMNEGGGRSSHQGGPPSSSSSLLQGEVSIVPNASTNDLVIVASPRDFLAIKSVIRELDRPRRQVFVEAVIMEVSLERSRELGIVMHGGNTFETSKGDGFIAGRTELNGMQSLSPAAMFLGGSGSPGFLAGLVGPTLELGGLKIPAVGMLIKTLQTNADVNVLSTPTLLTLDNEEATISVGERIPYVTNTGGLGGLGNLSGLAGQNGIDPGIWGGAGGLLGGYGTQISRIDIALTIRIKPQINENGAVRLTISEEIEEVKPGGSDLGGPTTRMRNLSTVVVVPDQQTVVLGGLVRDSESQSVSKVPILGDIPVLGYLFRSTDKKVQKQNLLMMLTPYVIESNEDLEKIRIRKEKEREEFVEFFGRKDMNYVRSVNYDKKNGIIESMRQKIDAKESELNAIREAQDVVRYVPESEAIEMPEGFSTGYEQPTQREKRGKRNR